MLRDMCRAFADNDLAPNAGKWDQAHEFPVDAVKQMGEMGLMGVAQPVEYNGAGSHPRFRPPEILHLPRRRFVRSADPQPQLFPLLH